MILIDEISKAYQDQTVLESISTQLPNQGFISIVGANGAGKSTLLSIMGRLLLADSGKITIDDLNVVTTKSDILAKKIAILKQENHFNARLTIEELVSFGRYPYTKGRLTKEDHAIIHRSLDFLNLTHLRHRYLDELSGGQKQRAYIAMVLSQETDYLLLDEPLNNLDIKHSVMMMKLLKQTVLELGKTVILVIHDINFAAFYSDYILALKNGKICYQGAPQEIMNPDILEQIFETKFQIKTVEEKPMAFYYG